jgi:hypothetical protein
LKGKDSNVLEVDDFVDNVDYNFSYEILDEP